MRRQGQARMKRIDAYADTNRIGDSLKRRIQGRSDKA